MRDDATTSTAALNAALLADAQAGGEGDDGRVNLDVPNPSETPILDADAASSAGLAARLQSRLAQIERDRAEEFDVPGWGPTLRLRMQRVDATTIRGLGRNPRVDQVIAAATDAVIIDTDDGQTETDLSGLADLMGIPGARGDAVVMKVCGGDLTRVRTLFSIYWDWRTGQVAAVEEELGE